MLCERCLGKRFVLKKIIGLLCSVPCPCCAMAGTVGDDGTPFEDPDLLFQQRLAAGLTAGRPTAVGAREEVALGGRV